MGKKQKAINDQNKKKVLLNLIELEPHVWNADEFF